MPISLCCSQKPQPAAQAAISIFVCLTSIYIASCIMRLVQGAIGQSLSSDILEDAKHGCQVQVLLIALCEAAKNSALARPRYTFGTLVNMQAYAVVTCA